MYDSKPYYLLKKNVSIIELKVFCFSSIHVIKVFLFEVEKHCINVMCVEAMTLL